jgi:glycosyltransferase involved in cell wall biosynthesis
MKIIHIISGLNDGGAEAVLFRLCTHDRDYQHVVAVLSHEGKYGSLLKEKGVQVTIFPMCKTLVSFFVFFKLVRFLREQRPDIVQTWMYHADFIGGLAARIAGIKSIVWNIRHSRLESGKSRLSTIILGAILSKLSYLLPSRIVVCSKRANTAHAALGYDKRIMQLIHNGYDLSDFVPKPMLGQRLRQSFEIPVDVPLIGSVGRYDPYKDHDNLLNAIALIIARGVKFSCLLVGLGMDDANKELVALINRLGLGSVVTLVGRRSDIPVVMSALDVHVLSSSSEAFPNVVAEAMACQTPCVVTDVGDAAYIVGETGWVVRPKNASDLAEAIEAALRESREADWKSRGTSARNRVSDLFGIDQMVREYKILWNECIQR